MITVKKFKIKDLIPAIIQDNKTAEVLMLGYMNTEALNKTITTGFVWFWSRSKKRLWMKGEESGNKLKVKEIYADCDNDSILIKTDLIGKSICHTGRKSCFFRMLP